jgi:hypothetical protein
VRTQTVADGELRKACLDRPMATAQFIILGVGDGGRVFLIVAAIVAGNFIAKPRMLGLRLFLSQRFNSRQ